MDDTKKAILIVLCSTIFTSLGQIALKKGSEILGFSINSIIFNYPLLLGIIFYAAGAFLYILALRYGELTVVLPLISTSFIWVSFLSIRFLGETMNLLKWGGIFFIIIGVSLIGIEGHKHSKENSKGVKE